MSPAADVSHVATLGVCDSATTATEGVSHVALPRGCDSATNAPVAATKPATTGATSAPLARSIRDIARDKLARQACDNRAKPVRHTPVAGVASVPGVAGDPDRFCWPDGPAANSAEILAMERRIDRFRSYGLTAVDADRLADRLLLRDRDLDTRVMCVECRFGRAKRCAGAGPLAGDVLHRCPAFEDAT